MGWLGWAGWGGPLASWLDLAGQGWPGLWLGLAGPGWKGPSTSLSARSGYESKPSRRTRSSTPPSTSRRTLSCAPRAPSTSPCALRFSHFSAPPTPGFSLALCCFSPLPLSRLWTSPFLSLALSLFVRFAACRPVTPSSITPPLLYLPLPPAIPVAKGLGVGSPSPPWLSTLSIALSLSSPSHALRSNFTLALSLLPARSFRFSSPNFSLALSCTLHAHLAHSSHFSPARELPFLITLAALPSNHPRFPSLCPSHAIHPSYASSLFQGTWLATRPLRATSLATCNGNTLNSSNTR